MDPLTIGAGIAVVTAVAGASQAAESLGAKYAGKTPSSVLRHDRDGGVLKALNARR